MRKEDYMKLSKERLAELLVERDLMEERVRIPFVPSPNTIPCYAYGGICTNPLHDCMNCPKFGLYQTSTTGTLTT